MHLTVAEKGRITVVTVAGDFLGGLHGPALREAIEALRTTGKVDVVIDLRASTMIDSAGLGALIEAATTLRAQGGDVRLAVREGRLRRLFVMTGLLGRVLTVFDTQQEAVASYFENA